jgi:hypothetical protein
VRPPAQPQRRPATQPSTAHGRAVPSAAPLRDQGLRSSANRRRQDTSRDQTLPQASDRPRDLPAPRSPRQGRTEDQPGRLTAIEASSPSDWRARPPKPDTAPTSPPRPTWPPAATAPPSKAAGPTPCASSPAPPCS